ncbi:DNA polymerase iota [Megachile rotundata]|uniref:DNA polymerase iota n=1 Tax=Megachile rotundata TaxID=143995 RepID=UPI000258F15F|nr:PREDICTED: DNA polymerase iota [Megachile rotundata]XP_012148103.1 PREDICTED: DNA polymerase iota [Megachile rotundata]XP_012148104.1 PREDICTED: DNA polymerase iota [Megachile rotundata]XP_012148105.1 PREDICTED: DNA polymerase iota [Megachile rotundata]XP_012148107.1 PREDICTED: DNA polymerase iota [Megachile rotundata]
MDSADFDAIIRHPRTIIHIDVDCFYAQVEMLRHPEFEGKPLGVQQKNIVVTSNYLAREYGIKKCMSVQEALKLCPGLNLVNGEDLTNYRHFSDKILEVLHQFTPLVERLGFDDNFLDATSLVQKYMNPGNESDLNMSISMEDETPIGEVFGSVEEECPCGCHARLIIATKIAAEIRQRIHKELHVTCSAGIAHNKLLAKLVGSLHKPNQQTLIFPCNAPALLSSIGSVSKIPGVGQKTTQLLLSNNIKTVDDLRKTPLETLEGKIGVDLARKLKDNAEGVDETVVKPTGKKQSIGLEDGFKSVSLVAEVESRLGVLLRRLTELAMEDGRIPVAMRLTVRKHDFNKPSSGKRETRQCALPKHLLPSSKSGIYDHAKMLALAMKLFHRTVDVSKPFHLTLLGVAFTKFEERSSGKNSITSFLRKQVAVQSVLDISSEEGVSDISLGSPMSTNQDSNDGSAMSTTSSPISKPVGANNQSADDDILNEIEPLPKKTRLEVWLSGRRESPSNEMADLRLSPSSPMQLSPKIDAAVLKSLPIDIQREVTRPWPTTSKPKPNNILKYFIANK